MSKCLNFISARIFDDYLWRENEFCFNFCWDKTILNDQFNDKLGGSFSLLHTASTQRLFVFAARKLIMLSYINNYTVLYILSPVFRLRRFFFNTFSLEALEYCSTFLRIWKGLFDSFFSSGALPVNIVYIFSKIPLHNRSHWRARGGKPANCGFLYHRSFCLDFPAMIISFTNLLIIYSGSLHLNPLPDPRDFLWFISK